MTIKLIKLHGMETWVADYCGIELARALSEQYCRGIALRQLKKLQLVDSTR